jgi:hypothetical protein
MIQERKASKTQKSLRHMYPDIEIREDEQRFEKKYHQAEQHQPFANIIRKSCRHIGKEPGRSVE